MTGILNNKDKFSRIDVNLTGFVLAYKELMYKNKELVDFYSDDTSIYFMPAIVNLGFAIELALKSLLEKQGLELKKIKEHRLNDLFYKLDINLQDKIIQKTIQMSKIKYDIIKKGSLLKKSEFNVKLEKNNNPFVEWRYFHEGKKIFSSDIDFLEELMFALTLSKDDFKVYLSKII